MNRTEQIYEYIIQFREEYGYNPSLREIAQACGLSSTSVVAYHLQKLEAQDRIVRPFNKVRAIKIVE